MAIFGWIASAVLYWRLRNISAKSQRRDSGGFRAILPHFGRVFAPLFGLMLLRNYLVVGMSLYLVVYLVQKGYGLVEAGQMLALYEFAGVGGALAGGTLSDRFGRKQTVMAATIIAAVMMFFFLNVEGVLMLPVLVLLGFSALSVTPVLQAFVQDQMPQNRATGSGTFILFSFVIRAALSLLIGAIGDAAGLGTAYWISIGVSLLAVPVVLLLPDAPAPTDAG